VVNKEGKVIKSNLAKRKSGDRTPTIGDIMYKDYGSKHEIDMFTELMNCIKTGKGKEFPKMKYENKYLTISIAPFPEGAIIISQNITERIKAEEALKQSEQRFRLIVETMPSLLVITDKEGKNLYVSPNSKEITGYSNEELENNFIWWVHEDDLDRAKNVFNISIKENKGGRNFEYKAVKKNGKVWYASSSWEPIINDKGDFQGMILQTIDISDRKIMEEEIAKVQKLESIGILAGGIAHDFNNFLTGIIGNISLAKLKTDPKDEIYEILTESEKAAHSAKSLTQQLLTFSKGGVPIKEKTDIKNLIKESAKFAIIGSSINCEFDFQENLWEVIIDKAQMTQVVNNIIINAIEAIPEEGIITIKAENSEVKEN
ncbi:MAG: PAS domain S-box protein, partial [candidate division WOR-3 bacterium]